MKALCAICYGPIQMIVVAGESHQEVPDSPLDRISQSNSIIQMAYLSRQEHISWLWKVIAGLTQIWWLQSFQLQITVTDVVTRQLLWRWMKIITETFCNMIHLSDQENPPLQGKLQITSFEKKAYLFLRGHNLAKQMRLYLHESYDDLFKGIIVFSNQQSYDRSAYIKAALCSFLFMFLSAFLFHPCFLLLYRCILLLSFFFSLVFPNLFLAILYLILMFMFALFSSIRCSALFHNL